LKKFKFRLEKVLEYRAMEEQWAKEAYLAARLQTLSSESELALILEARAELLSHPLENLEDRRALQLLLEKSDEDERSSLAVIEVLRNEEASAMEAWKLKRQDLKALTTLRDEALAEWELAANRKEQEALDEWSVTRRSA